MFECVSVYNLIDPRDRLKDSSKTLGNRKALVCPVEDAGRFELSCIFSVIQQAAAGCSYAHL